MNSNIISNWTEEEIEKLTEMGYSQDKYGEFTTMGDYANCYVGNSASKDGKNSYSGTVVYRYYKRDDYEYDSETQGFDNFQSLISFIGE